LRKSPPRNDDAVVKQAIANVVKYRATYGYRRVWARLRLEGRDRINHKRVYRVMRVKAGGSTSKPTKPIEWLTVNGSWYTAAETRSFAKQLGLKPVTTPVTSPQSNGMAESFVKTLKRDYAKLADRPDSQTVMAQLPKWFDDYNSYHPHSALGYVPAKLFREKRAVN
jgi:putative transposase